MISHLSAQVDQLPVEFEEIPGTDFRDRESLMLVPLFLYDVPLGLLSVQHADADVYHVEDLNILTLLGNHVVSTLSNLQLFDNLRQLNETGQLLSRQLGSEEVLQDVVNRIQTTTQADLALLYPYDQVVGQFQFPAYLSGQLLKPDVPRPNAARPEDIVSLALRQPKPIFAEDSLTLYKTLKNRTNLNENSFVKREAICSTAVVPLRVIEEAVGVLFLNFRQPQVFEASKKQFIHGLANYAAIAIKNAREFGALARRRSEELATLQEIDRKISKSLDLQEVLQTILEVATEHIATDKGVILLYDDREKTLVKEAVIGRGGDNGALTAIPLDQEKGITRWVFEYKKPVRIGNVRQDPNWREMYINGNSETLSELDVPLLVDDEVIGVINLESSTEDAFSQADEHFLMTLSGQAVLAIKNAQAYENQQYLLYERDTLNEIGNEIIAKLDSASVFGLILDKALEITGSTVGTLMLYDPQRNDLWMAAERGVVDAQKGERHSLDEGITGWVAQRKESLNIGDISEPPWNKVHLPFIPNVRSELAVPLLEGGKLRGVINIESPRPHHFEHSDERLLMELADLAVIALQNAERYKKAKEGKAKIEALQEVDKKIISQLDDPDQVMRTILENASFLTGAEIVGLYLYLDGHIVSIYRARLEPEEDGLAIKRVDVSANQAPPRSGIVEYVASNKKSYIMRSDSHDDPYYYGSPDIQSELAVPLLSGGQELIGVLNLESPRRYAFDNEAMALLELFAGQAVIAIQNADRYAQATRRANRFRLLHEAARKLGEITDLDQLEQAYDIVTGIAEEHIQSQVIIHRYDPDAQELILVRTAQWEKTPPLARVKLEDQGLSRQTIQEKGTLVVPDIERPPPELVDLKPFDSKIRSLGMTAIQFEEYYYGRLAVTHEKPNYFKPDSDDVKLIEGLAGQLAITIHRLEMIEAQQEAEQRALAAEVMSSIGQQSFELAHRLGNDLGLVKSYVNNIKEELAEQGIDSASIDGNLRKIVRDVRQVLMLSTNLKQELAEFRSKQPSKADRAVVPTRILLEEAAENVILSVNNIQMHFEVADEVAPVYVAHSQAADILHNLLVNAVQAMLDGGKITLKARNAGRYVEISIADSGLGIPRDKQPDIFDFLYSTKGSSGFGLWSARRKALANGGDLRLKDSRPGEGTTFTLRLPRADQKHRGVR